MQTSTSKGQSVFSGLREIGGTEDRNIEQGIEIVYPGFMGAGIEPHVQELVKKLFIQHPWPAYTGQGENAHHYFA